MAKKKNKTKKEITRVNNKIYGILLNYFYSVVGIICFLCFFYLLTLYITTKNSEDTTSDNSNDNSNAEASISYDDIMVGRSFSMSDGEYLVLYYDKADDDISSTYSGLVSTYSQKDGHLKLYTVNMGNSFNSAYTTGGESNKTPATISDLKINGPTLIKISNNTAVEYIEGEEAITNYLQ